MRGGLKASVTTAHCFIHLHNAPQRKRLPQLIKRKEKHKIFKQKRQKTATEKCGKHLN